MYNLVNLKDKTIIVTGASSGIGKATVLLLDRLEANVVMVARNEEKLQEIMAGMNGMGHSYFSCDLSQLDGIEALVKRIIEEKGSIDGFVHSAGTGGGRPLKVMEPSNLQEVMQINTFAFIELVRCITKKGRYGENLSIVGVSSISAMQGNKSKVAYCASKGALDAAVRAMAKELASKKIRVNTVNPGLIQTPLYDEIMLGAGGHSEDFQSIINRQYLGLGKAEDVANLIAFILSDASAFMTGSSVVLDGGRLSS